MTPGDGLLVEAQQRIAELAPEIPLYNVTRLDAVPASLENFKGNPTNAGIFWNVHEWASGRGPVRSLDLS